MERIPILRMGQFLLVTIQVDMHDRLAVQLQDDLTEKISEWSSRGVLIDISTLEIVDSFIGRMLANIAAMARVLDAETVVVGMHDALPDSVSAGHSMNESAQMERSGRRAYQDLLAFRNKTKKFVYVLASHSHFLMEDPYNDMCHRTPDTVLPGWIVGTAGAVRYRLPVNLAGAKQAKTDVYGYVLGTVQPTGEVRFAFKEVTRDKIPSNTLDRYGAKQVDACFEENKSPYTPAGPSCPSPESGTR